MNPTFLWLTRSEGKRIRVNFFYCVAYLACDKEMSTRTFVEMVDGYYHVMETVEQIDQMLEQLSDCRKD